jgi:hypothetical protein
MPWKLLLLLAWLVSLLLLAWLLLGGEAVTRTTLPGRPHEASGFSLAAQISTIQ